MIAHGPKNVPTLAATPDLEGVGRVMERFAADQNDSFAFEVSRLIAAVACSLRLDDPLGMDEIESRCHSIAYAWLLQQLDAALADES
jgi:hypothetical protein